MREEIAYIEDMDDPGLDMFLFKIIEAKKVRLADWKGALDEPEIEEYYGICIDVENLAGTKYLKLLDEHGKTETLDAYHNDWTCMRYNKDLTYRPPSWYVKEVFVSDDYFKMMNKWKSCLLTYIFNEDILDMDWTKE